MSSSAISTWTQAARMAVDAATAAGADEADAWVRAVGQPEASRLRGHGREPDGGHEPRRRGARVRRWSERLRLRLRPERGCAGCSSPRDATEAAAVTEPDEHAGLPERAGAPSCLRCSRRSSRAGTPSARSSWRSRSNARRATAIRSSATSRTPSMRIRRRASRSRTRTGSREVTSRPSATRTPTRSPARART